MEVYLKITAVLLLLVQASHLASLRDSTDSPGRTIDKGWLRELLKNTAGSQNTTVPEVETEYDQANSGTPSGFMAIYNEEEENAIANDGSDDVTVIATTEPPAMLNVTTKQPELQNATVSPTTSTADPTNSSQVNMTNAEEEFHNSTTTPQNSTTDLSAQNSTTLPDYSNHTDLPTTTMAPEGNATQESTTKPDEDTGSINATESTTTTVTTTLTPEINETPTTSSSTMTPEINETPTTSSSTMTPEINESPTTSSSTTPEINETPTTSSSTTVFLSETTEMSPETTTAAAPNTPEKANKTEQGSALGTNSERGLESDLQRSKRKGAWGAVLGTAVAVACVGLVAYIILKKKHQKGFSHRKLVEEYPSDPVLRLDNTEPLDLNLGGSAYYNPGLQGDNMQMTNFPGGRGN
ncbi:mucin-15 [Dicentrarchus labrax]|uniref:Mucin-15 n=1 Tax=Dicentrarchus labrax TaxID=13489 RepID=A0A8C4I9F5_DICLA|nr:mucin-15 [Dicentrarchus labrax]